MGKKRASTKSAISQNKINEIQKRNEELEERNEAFQEQIDILETEVSELEEKKDKLVEEAEAATGIPDNPDLRIQGLESREKQLTQTNKNLVKELEEAKSQIGDLKKGANQTINPYVGVPQSDIELNPELIAQCVGKITDQYGNPYATRHFLTHVKTLVEQATILAATITQQSNNNG